MADPVGSGQVFFINERSGRVQFSAGWIVSGQEKWTPAQLCSKQTPTATLLQVVAYVVDIFELRRVNTFHDDNAKKVVYSFVDSERNTSWI